MLYAYGDVSNPRHDTVSVLEDIVVDFISTTCQQASALATDHAHRHKVKVDDFKFLLRPSHQKDGGKKIGRVEELLYMQEVIKRARQQFNTKEDEWAGAAEVVNQDPTKKRKSKQQQTREKSISAPPEKRQRTETRELSEDDDYDEE